MRTGVSFGGTSKQLRFQAVHGSKSLGYFASAEEAALAYARHMAHQTAKVPIPKLKSARGSSEKVREYAERRKNQQQLCGTCKQPGHKARTCPNHTSVLYPGFPSACVSAVS